MHKSNSLPFNWPAVAGLLFLTAIPAIPAVFLILAVALGPDAIASLSSMVNPVHFDTPLALYIHGGSGIAFFLTMPFQFSYRLRRTHTDWHKRAGKIAVLSGMILALSGLWIHHVFRPGDFGPRFVSLVIMSAMMCFAFAWAVRLIMVGNHAGHRIWMMRAVAISLAAVTPLFLEPLIILLAGGIESTNACLQSLLVNYGRLIAIAVNLVIVEALTHERSVQRPRSQNAF